MDNNDKKGTTDRFYSGYRNSSYNYPVEPHSANSFLRHSQQSSGRQSWNEELEKTTPVRLENPIERMKKLDREFEKKEKPEPNTGRGKY